jgi:hypothetical protein
MLRPPVLVPGQITDYRINLRMVLDKHRMPAACRTTGITLWWFYQPSDAMVSLGRNCLELFNVECRGHQRKRSVLASYLVGFAIVVAKQRSYISSWGWRSRLADGKHGTAQFGAPITACKASKGTNLK